MYKSGDILEFTGNNCFYCDNCYKNIDISVGTKVIVDSIVDDDDEEEGYVVLIALIATNGCSHQYTECETVYVEEVTKLFK